MTFNVDNPGSNFNLVFSSFWCRYSAGEDNMLVCDLDLIHTAVAVTTDQRLDLDSDS